VLAPLGATVAATPARGGGEDFRPLQAQGVPVVGVRQDGTSYFDVHHSTADTVDRVDWRSLRQVLAVWTPLLWLLANDPDGFRKWIDAGERKFRDQLARERAGKIQ